MDITAYLESLPWSVSASFIVIVFVLCAIVGLLIIRRFITPESLKAHHDVAGFVFTNLGVLYAVLLGFTVVNVQQRFDTIRSTIQVEASYLSSLYRDSEVFNEKDKNAIRTSLKNYAQSVLSDEWELMAQGTISIPTHQHLQEVWTNYYQVKPSSEKQNIWYAESIRNLNKLMQARLKRISASQSSLGAEMWTLLVLNSFVVVSFIYFFGLDSCVSQIAMTSILAATTAFLLFLIYSLDTAFSGNVQIPPVAIEHAVKTFL